MKRFLHALSIILSFFSSLFEKAEQLHHDRFARPHELADLLTDSLPSDSLLLGTGGSLPATSLGIISDCV